MRLHERATHVRARLERAGLRAEDAAFDAELLVRHALGWDRARWIAGQREPEPPSVLPAVEAMVARRERREPMAYILGMREFWGLDFEVTRDVLIPRSETELLVEETLARLPRAATGSRPFIVDVGTGSGCIAVALAVERPDAAIAAIDISPTALAVARRNAVRHGVTERIRFVQADLLAGVGGTPDVVVSNPPYVKRADLRALAVEVSENEPHTALFGAGADGLDTIRALLQQSAALLPPGAWLLFEFGYGQEETVERLVEAHPRLRLEGVRTDLQGIPRTAIVRRC